MFFCDVHAENVTHKIHQMIHQLPSGFVAESFVWSQLLTLEKKMSGIFVNQVFFQDLRKKRRSK